MTSSEINQALAKRKNDLAKALVRGLVIAECEATKRGRETKDELNAVKKLLQALCPDTKISTQDIKDCLP